jgi:uncharacterized membrane protein YphA (DoxX/SURF4 family)
VVDKLALLGRYFFAISMVAFGVQNLMYKGILKGLELTPEWAPGHAFWAYLDGVLLIAGGVCILIPKRARLGAALIAAVYLASVLLLHLPNVAWISDLGQRTVLFEPLTIGCAALILAGFDRTATAARVLIGVSMIVFGIDHFEILQFIANLIPKWMPDAYFLAAFTGVAFIAAGACIVIRWQMPLAAGMLGLMFFLWVVLLHGPRVAGNPTQNELNSAFVALAMCGLSWILAGETQQKPIR